MTQSAGMSAVLKVTTREFPIRYFRTYKFLISVLCFAIFILDGQEMLTIKINLY